MDIVDLVSLLQWVLVDISAAVTGTQAVSVWTACSCRVLWLAWYLVGFLCAESCQFKVVSSSPLAHLPTPHPSGTVWAEPRCPVEERLQVQGTSRWSAAVQDTSSAPSGVFTETTHAPSPSSSSWWRWLVNGLPSACVPRLTSTWSEYNLGTKPVHAAIDYMRACVINVFSCNCLAACTICVCTSLEEVFTPHARTSWSSTCVCRHASKKCYLSLYETIV